MSHTVYRAQLSRVDPVTSELETLSLPKSYASKTMSLIQATAHGEGWDSLAIGQHEVFWETYEDEEGEEVEYEDSVESFRFYYPRDEDGDWELDDAQEWP